MKAPHGIQMSCKGWVQESALRMLMNNLEIGWMALRYLVGAWPNPSVSLKMFARVADFHPSL